MRKIPLPEPVAKVYEAIAELEATFPERKFTMDGHLVGSIGEVVAAEALGLKLHPMSKPGHDAYDAKDNVDVQIKMTAGKSVAMYATCERLVVLQIISPKEAEIVYDGPGQRVWEQAGKVAKNGQRVIGLHKLRKIAAAAENQMDKWTWDVGDVEWETIPDPKATPIIAPEDVELAKQLLREIEQDRSARRDP